MTEEKTFYKLDTASLDNNWED